MTLLPTSTFANRASSPDLSSIARWHFSALGMAAMLVALPACAQPAPIAPAPQPFVASGTTDPLASTIAQWKSLSQLNGAGFAIYANFMINHPGWPGEADMRNKAEGALRPDVESPSQVSTFFRMFPPRNATAHLRHADALAALGDNAGALAAARTAWLSGALGPDDESRILTRYAAAFQPGDHDKRMDRLLWSRATAPATRQMALVSADRRTQFNARLAYLNRSMDAGSLEHLVPAEQRRDAGFVADQVSWMRGTNRPDAARVVLTSLPPLQVRPLDPLKWLEMLDSTTRQSAAQQDWTAVTQVARQVIQTYPEEQSPRDGSAAERNLYTDITWRAGMAALDKTGRSDEALYFFDLYSKAARSPQTRVKGLFWAARAALRGGKREVANAYYAQAAEFYDQFHGQLAAEQIGRKIAMPSEYATVEVSGTERSAFERSEVVRAADYLGRTGQWQDQTRFVRTLAARAASPADHVLAAELSKKLNRPDLAVLIGRSAREKGLPGYVRFSFPTIRVPDEHMANWTIIHAITRQESQFDQQAQSRVGARGLMQLMPGTARMTAPAAGVSYDLASLTLDPQHNMKLGATYFGQLMTRYNGSYILSVAAYNAGPGNVNKWLAANGDPRVPGVDPLRWIEAIPFTETRGYVQRVLENFVVYDQLSPRNPKGGTWLTALLAPPGQMAGGTR
jgi:soluble lytic murein transglycosylase